MSRLPPAPRASTDAVRKVMQGNRSSGTQPEVRLRSALFKMGLRFRKHVQPSPDVRCRADVVFPKERVAVFVDGCFWHRCPEHGTDPRSNSAYWEAKLTRNVMRDRENDAALSEAGWLVIRVWEHESADAVASRVASAVLTRR